MLFGGSTVPGLVLDGRKVLGSRRIVRALEDKVPDPPLLPADDKERKSVELAEGWGDEVLQPLVRRAIWAALRRAPAAIPSYSEGSKLPTPLTGRLSAPGVVAPSRHHAASDLNDAPTLAHAARGHLARVDRWIETA